MIYMCNTIINQLYTFILLWNNCPSAGTGGHYILKNTCYGIIGFLRIIYKTEKEKKEGTFCAQLYGNSTDGMKYIYEVYNEVYMKYIWSIYEVYMKYIWSIYEIYMKYEVYMKYIWSIYEYNEVYMKYICI